MNITSKTSPWHQQTKSTNHTTLTCPRHDTIKDFIMEPSGHYVLIHPNFEKIQIDVALCNPKNEIIITFEGRNAQDLYHSIFETEKKQHANWFQEKTHIAYLGKELKKAELALTLGNTAYFQE